MILYYLLSICLVKEIYGLFTHRDYINGNIGIGKLPIELNTYIDSIVDNYKDIIPDETVTTYHISYTDISIPYYLKNTIDTIQNYTLWNDLCDKNLNCNVQIIPEMTELYYSNPNKKTINLYGAAANFDLHTDCFYNFEYIKLYRVLIGLTNGNNNTITYFPSFNVGHKLNKGDYIVFDFDRTLHKVIKLNESSSKRILLKLHFLIYQKEYSYYYKYCVKYMYVYYDFITRYILENGTDPETFFQFFMGLLSELYINYITTYHIVLLCNVSILLIYYYKYKITDIIIIICKAYIIVVSYYWLRYKLFNIK